VIAFIAPQDPVAGFRALGEREGRKDWGRGDA